MKRPIKVLLVDDKKDYCESLAGIARLKNIQISYALDWETGFDTLKGNPHFEFVILDGKGKIEAEQEKEKDNFVIRAIDDIRQYAHQNLRDIPFCVNTGFIDRFETLEGNVEVFEKNDEHREKMFEYILAEVENSKYRTVRKPFEEAFKAIDMGIISKNHEKLLLEILECYNNKDFKKKNLNVQRDMLEAIFISLNKSIPCIPDSLFFTNEKPNHAWCTRFMEDRPTKDAERIEHKLNRPVPKSIKSAFRKLKESTNEYSHLADEELIKLPFLANTFLLMEILEWLPTFAKTHYANYI